MRKLFFPSFLHVSTERKQPIIRVIYDNQVKKAEKVTKITYFGLTLIAVTAAIPKLITSMYRYFVIGSSNDSFRLLFSSE